MTTRPTELSMAQTMCLHAITLRRNNPQDVAPFATGTAAHEVLYALGTGRDPAAIVDAMLSTGKPAPDPTPPLPPMSVWEGRNLAMSWWQNNPAPPDDAGFEQRMAVDWSGRAVDPDSPDAAIRTSLDVVWVESVPDEATGEPIRTAVVRDYKSSWQDRGDRTDHPQQRAQAVIASAQWSDVEAVRIEIANLRTGGLYTRTIDTRFDDTLDEWRRDVLALARVVESSDRAPRPGGQCAGCYVAEHCDARRDAMAGPDDVAAWGAAKAEAKIREARIKAALDEGREVAGAEYRPSERTVPHDDALVRLADRWSPTPEAATILRSFAAMLGKPSVAAVKALAKAIDKKGAADVVASVTDTVTSPRLAASKETA